jgi:hypothetical protein
MCHDFPGFRRRLRTLRHVAEIGTVGEEAHEMVGKFRIASTGSVGEILAPHAARFRPGGARRALRGPPTAPRSDRTAVTFTDKMTSRLFSIGACFSRSAK